MSVTHSAIVNYVNTVPLERLRNMVWTKLSQCDRYRLTKELIFILAL